MTPALAPASDAATLPRLAWCDRLHDAVPPRRRKALAAQAVALAVVLAFWFLPHLIVLAVMGIATDDPILVLTGGSEALAAHPEIAAEVRQADEQYRKVQVGGLVAVSFLIGLVAMGGLPSKSSGYRDWLARTPWTPARLLPLGGVGPGWNSAAWLAILVMLAMQAAISGWVAVAAFAAGMAYRSLDFIRAGARGWIGFAIALALLAALRLALIESLRPLSVALLVAAGGIGLLCARRSLWNLAHRADLEKRWARDFRQDLSGYTELALSTPLLRVAPVAPPVPWTKLQILAAAVLVGLAFNLMSAAEFTMFGDDPEFEGFLSFIGLIGLVTLGFICRLAMWTRGRQTAFPWWVRLRHGRLWMPRSDVLWLAPLAAPPVAVVTLLAGIIAGLALPEATGLSAAATLFVLCATGPSRRWYRLCGGGRIVVTLPARTGKSGKRRAEESGFELEL